MLFFRKGTYLGAVSHISDVSGAIVSLTTYPEQYRSDHQHYHENPHISVVIQGGNLEKRKTKAIERPPGKVTFYEEKEPHQITTVKDSSKHLNIEIDPRFLSAYEIDVRVFSHQSRLDNPGVTHRLLKLLAEVKTGDGHSPASIHALLLDVLHDTQRTHHDACVPAWVKTIRELLHDRWNEVVTLDELSQAAGVHPVTISKCFPRHFGASIGDYMRGIKVEKAAILIKNTNLTLSEIAFVCGFSDQSHFIRLFKQHTGFLPKHYQQI